MFVLKLRFNNYGNRPHNREEYQFFSEDIQKLQNKVDEAINHYYYKDIYFCIMEIPKEFSVVEISNLNIIDEDYL